MKPDIVISRTANGETSTLAVMDVKWKPARPDGRLASREDIMQLFAYASHWLAGNPGNNAGYEPEDDEGGAPAKPIALVYPDHAGHQTESFNFPLLPNVAGFALVFRLPSLNGAAHGAQWIEGFVDLPGELRQRFPQLEG